MVPAGYPDVNAIGQLIYEHLTKRLRGCLHVMVSGGVMVRLVDEVFRALPTLHEVEAVGMRATGERVAVLTRLRAGRRRFAEIALDEQHLEPLAHAAGGDRSASDRFEMVPLPTEAS